MALPDCALRVTAATNAFAAGVLHLAQIGVDAEESIEFAAFFLIVGLPQLAGAVALSSSSRTMRGALVGQGCV